MKTLQVLIDWREKIVDFLLKKGFICHVANTGNGLGLFKRVGIQFPLFSLEEVVKSENDKYTMKLLLRELMDVQMYAITEYGESLIQLFNEHVIWATMHDLDTSDITQSVASIYAVISRKEKADAPFLNYALCGFYEECARDGGWVINPNFGAQFLITQFIAK